MTTETKPKRSHQAKPTYIIVSSNGGILNCEVSKDKAEALGRFERLTAAHRSVFVVDLLNKSYIAVANVYGTVFEHPSCRL